MSCPRKAPDAGLAYDISKAQRVLGWEPRFNFEQAYAALTAR